MVSRFHLVSLVVLAGGAMSCAASPTQVIVVVDSDLRTPAELDALRITVTSPDGETQIAEGTFLAGDPPLPRTLALSHTTGPLGTFQVLVEGLRSGGVVVSRQARFDFRSERILVLTMHLARSCIAVDCGGGSTCTERGCESLLGTPAPLPEWTGAPPRLQDGTDGGRDAGFDVCAPMGVETCDGVDEDCDGSIDEGFSGTPETCDGVDEDCDGSVDEGFSETPETCDGVDEDCDGSVDEGFSEIFDTCDGGVDEDCDGSVDEGMAEVCNTVDDDCDGAVDEALSEVPEICDTLDQDCDGFIDENLAGVVEVCDGMDQDCDGMIDEGFDLTSDPTHCGRCGNVCTFMNGVASCISGTCVLESCNATFANCDGLLDNGCEVDTNISTANCGTCTNECSSPLRECCLGTCARRC